MCNDLWMGVFDMSWIHAARVICLRKPKDAGVDQDDPDAQRFIRPIGPPASFNLLIGSTGDKIR